MSLSMTLDSMLFSLGTVYRCLIIAAVLAAIAAVALARKLLDAKGTAAAFILGFIIFYAGGLSAFVIFLFFFLSSSFITKAARRERAGGRRGFVQVIANGLPASLSMIAWYHTLSPVFLIGFASAVAEAASDTWAGEIGQLSRRDPVSIITFTRVPKGISGGVTVLGLSASLLASSVIALLFLGTFGCGLPDVLAITAAGFLGALLDSFLGATVQVQYRRSDGTLTENAGEGERARGIPFIDNDMVNFISSLFAMAAGMGLHQLY